MKCPHQKCANANSDPGRAYELDNFHILALQSDFELLDQALRCLPKRGRPRVRLDGPREQGEEEDEDEDENEEEPMIVAEGGLRTDSSLGYPEYQGPSR